MFDPTTMLWMRVLIGLGLLIAMNAARPYWDANRRNAAIPVLP
jgi:hypothetical protein